MIVLIVLAALGVGAKLRYRGKAPVRLSAQECDPELWKHVYERERLEVLEECTAVQGKVVAVHRASDGDLHIALNPEQKSVLNLINVMHAKSTLVVEVICEHEPAAAAAKATCADFHPQINIPKAGERVRITGAYVTDRDNGWNEIHPVTRVEILR